MVPFVVAFGLLGLLVSAQQVRSCGLLYDELLGRPVIYLSRSLDCENAWELHVKRV